MPLSIERREIEGIGIFDLRGRVVVGPEATELREALSRAAATPNPNLILNFEQVHFIDSTGLGTLVVGHSLIKQAGGALKLLNLSKRSAQLLILTKLSTVFEIFNDEQDAINSFFPDREVKRFDILEFVTSAENENAPAGKQESQISETKSRGEREKT